MSNKHHYGRPLEVTIEQGALVIRLGVQTLAHAVTYSEWANQWNDQKQEYIRSFAIMNAEEFAGEVTHMMLKEREDGSSPLSDFLDTMTEAAVDDGSMACEYDQQIKHGETSPLETWAAKVKANA